LLSVRSSLKVRRPRQFRVARNARKLRAQTEELGQKDW
jgi:hypothetical protein